MIDPPIISDRYRVIRQIGQGTNGRVYEAHDQLSGKNVAIKVPFDTDIGVEQRNHRKLEVLDQLRRDERFFPAGNMNISHLDGNEDNPFLVMPLCKVTLEEYVSYEEKHGTRVKPDDALKVVRRIVTGLRTYYNCSKNCHGDLSARNVMLFSSDDFFNLDSEIVITDTGTATKIDPRERTGNPRDRIGFIGIQAPELNDDDSVPTQATDFYSLGAIVYRLLKGKYPDSNFISESYLDDNLRDKKFPKSLKPFLRSCLSRDPSKRPQNIDELESRLGEAIAAYESSKPSARARRIRNIAAITLLGIAGSIPGYYKFVSVRDKNADLERQIEQNQRDELLDVKHRVIDDFMSGRDSVGLGVREFIEYEELQSWVFKFDGDKRTAIAAYLNPELTYEAIQRASGRSDYMSVRSQLQQMPDDGKTNLKLYAMVDELTLFDKSPELRDLVNRTAFDVDRKCEEARKKYEEKLKGERK